MLDANCAWSAVEAIENIRRLESLHLRWVEEPVWPSEDYDSLQRVGALAAAVGVAVAPHSYYLGPGLAATLQFISSTPEVSLIEMASTELALPLLLEPVRATGGFVEVSTRPGLGADPNPEALARYIAGGSGI